MLDLTKPGAEVFNPVDSEGTARGASMGDAQVWSTEMEALVKDIDSRVIAGIRWITQEIAVKSTGNVNISSGLENGDTIDGLTLETGMHVFLGSQTNAAQNGIYTVVASGAASRATFADSAAELARIGFVVKGGSTGANSKWTLALDADDITLGTTDLVFSPYAYETDDSAAIAAIEGEITPARDSETNLATRLTRDALRSRATGTIWFNYSNTTTEEDPGSTNIRFDNANLTLVTKIYISETAILAGSLTAFLSGLVNGPHLLVVAGSTNNMSAAYEVTGGTDNGTWRTLNVVYHSGNTSLSNGTVVGVSRIPNTIRRSEFDAALVRILSNGAVPYQFDHESTDTGTAPNAGFFRANSADMTAVTEITVRIQNFLGTTSNAYFEALDDAPHFIEVVTATASFVRTVFRVTAVATITNARRMTVAYVSGATSIANSAVVGFRGIPTTISAADVATLAGRVTTAENDIAALEAADILHLSYIQANGWIYQFDDTATDGTDIPAGKFRANHATISSATVLYLSNTSLTGQSLSGVLSQIDAAPNWIEMVSSSGSRISFYVESETSETGHRAVTVSNHAGNSDFSNDAIVGVNVTRAHASPTTFAALGSRLTTAESDIDTLESTVGTHGTRLDTAEGDIDTLESATSALDGRLTTAESDIDTLESTVASHGGRLDTAEADIVALEAADVTHLNYIKTGWLWQFDDTSTSSTDIPAGKFRANNALVASATELYFSNTTLTGQSVNATLGQVDTFPNFIELTAGNSGNRISFFVDGESNGTGCRILNVSGANGNSDFANNDIVGAKVSRTPLTPTQYTALTTADTTNLNYIKANGWLWQFDDTATTGADLPAGKFRANHATISSATEFYFSETTLDGRDVGAALGQIANTSNYLEFTSGATNGFHLSFHIDAVVDSGNYRTVTVSSHSGNSDFSNDQIINVRAIRSTLTPAQYAALTSADSTAATRILAASGWLYTYDASSTSPSGISAGTFRANDANLSLATELYVSTTALTGHTTVGTSLGHLDVAPSYLDIAAADNLRRVSYEVTTETSQTGYRHLNVIFKNGWSSLSGDVVCSLRAIPVSQRTSEVTAISDRINTGVASQHSAIAFGAAERSRRELGPGATNWSKVLTLAPGITLPSDIAFTRANVKYLTGPDGWDREVAVNVPADWYHPTTNEWLGVLIEGADTNDFIQTGDMTNVAWSTGGLTEVTPAARIGADGTSSMFKIVESAGSGTHFIGQAVNLTAGVTRWAHLDIAAGERSIAHIRLTGSAFDTTLVALFYANTGNFENTTDHPLECFAVYHKRGNFWRIYVRLVADNTASGSIVVRLCNDSGSSSYTGDGSSGLYTSRWQLDTKASSYIPTVAAPVTRARDVMNTATTDFKVGSMYVRGILPVLQSGTFMSIESGTNDRITLGMNAARLPTFHSRVSSVSVETEGHALRRFDEFIAAADFNDGVGANFSVNGEPCIEAESFTAPTVNLVRLGSVSATGAPGYYCLREFGFHRKAIGKPALEQAASVRKRGGAMPTAGGGKVRLTDAAVTALNAWTVPDVPVSPEVDPPLIFSNDYEEWGTRVGHETPSIAITGDRIWIAHVSSKIGRPDTDGGGYVVLQYCDDLEGGVWSEPFYLTPNESVVALHVNIREMPDGRLLVTYLPTSAPSKRCTYGFVISNPQATVGAFEVGRTYFIGHGWPESIISVGDKMYMCISESQMLNRNKYIVELSFSGRDKIESEIISTLARDGSGSGLEEWDEPSIIPASAGRWFMMYRSLLGQRYAWTDVDGTTWGETAEWTGVTPTTNGRACAKLLPSGRWGCAVNHAATRHNLKLLLSEDEGETWPREVMIESRQYDNPRPTYPQFVVDRFGRILTAYDYARSDAEGAIVGGKAIVIARISEAKIWAGEATEADVDKFIVAV